jgi:hypothetical protein
MNKETILECFFKKRDVVKAMKDLCENYPKYLTKIGLQPANFEKYETVTSQGRSMFNDQQSSLEKTHSLCSAFSRITIDKTVYLDIIKNRKKHNIFLDLEEEDIKEKKWHYKDEKDNIFGPYSSEKMNDFFQLYKLTEKFKVKEKHRNDDFIPFKILIKRYYKKILAENLDIEKSRSRTLSKKTQEFRKGDRIKNNNKNKKESFVNQGRVQRVLSDEVKPNLYFLDNIIEEESDSEDDGDDPKVSKPPQTRIRSLTSATK